MGLAVKHHCMMMGGDGERIVPNEEIDRAKSLGSVGKPSAETLCSTWAADEPVKALSKNDLWSDLCFRYFYLRWLERKDMRGMEVGKRSWDS